MNTELLESIKGILDAKLDGLNIKLDSLREDVDKLKAGDLVEKVLLEGQCDPQVQITAVPQVGSVSYWVPDPSTTPAKFSGEDPKYTLVMFKFATEMWFGGSSLLNDSVDDFDRITKIGSLLIGHPARWWSSFGLLSREKAPVYRTNLLEFWKNMDSYYGVKKMPFEDEMALLNLTQRTRDISAFNLKFRQLSANIDWTKEKLEAALYLSKLNDMFITHMKSSPPLPETVAGMMDSTSLYDPRFMAMIRNSSGVAPQQRVSHTKTEDIRVSKRESGCFHCHNVGHIRSNCPMLKSKSSVATSGNNGGNNGLAGQGKGPATRQ